MDLNRLNNSQNEAHARYEEMRRETHSSNADRVRGARQALARLSDVRAERIRRGRAQATETQQAEVNQPPSRHNADQIEISDRARIMARQHEQAAASQSDDSARAERVSELKQRHAAGKINTPEAIDRAAQNLLRQSG